ncbi:MAG: hypothetical protein GY862_24190 [Gammaproteobacteria bacterium]|nr:hypothetical protein [Gammaproteobacteria bacterium]
MTQPTGRLRYDVFFKKVFHKKHLLKAFLNTVLASELPAPITDLSYEPVDFVIAGKSRLIQKTKHDVIDIFCLTAQQQRIFVELQKGAGKRAIPHFLDYQCRNYSNQFPAGAEHSRIVPCYSICWLFDLQPPHDRIKEIVTLHSDCSPTDWTFSWEIVALYPRNIPPAHIKEHTIDALEEWLLLDVIEDIASARQVQQLLYTEEVKEAFEDLDLSELSEDEIRRVIFEDQISQYPDLYEEKVREEVRERVRERVREEVREEVREDRHEIARNLLDILDIETICQKTGLSREEVESLQTSAD